MHLAKDIFHILAKLAKRYKFLALAQEGKIKNHRLMVIQKDKRYKCKEMPTMRTWKSTGVSPIFSNCLKNKYGQYILFSVTTLFTVVHFKQSTNEILKVKQP